MIIAARLFAFVCVCVCVCVCMCVCVCDAVPSVNDTAAHPNKGEWCLGTLGRHS